MAAIVSKQKNGETGGKNGKIRRFGVRYFQKAGSIILCAGFTFKIFLIISILFINISIYALKKLNICEPSIVYNDIFLIDCIDIFSYTTVNDIYDDIDKLQDYLNTIDISEEQIYIRYLMYLRKKQLFPAIVSLIFLVNNNDYHFRYNRENRFIYNDGARELLNLLEIYAKKNDNLDNNTINNMLDSPANIDELSNKLFYSLKVMMSKTTSIRKILFSSLLYSISDIPPEIDFGNDKFAKYLLLCLMKMRDNKILSDYISYFDDSVNGNKPKYSYRTFVILRKLGLLSVDFSSLDKISNIIISDEFIKKINLKNQNKSDKKIDGINLVRSDDCLYLDNRKKWILEAMPGERDVLLFNNSAMIVEQCHETFLLFAPFVQEGSDFIIFENNLWIRYFVEALDEIVQNRLDEKSAEALLEAGFRASLREGRETQTDSWWFFFYMSTRDDYMTLLKALILKQTAELGWKSYNENSVSEATDIIFEALYGKGL